MIWSDVLSIFLVQMFGPETNPLTDVTMRNHQAWKPTKQNEEPPW